MSIIINRLELGFLGVNTYFLIDKNLKKTIITDPGGNGEEIIKFIKENGLFVEMIINTHGHPDHTEANEFLQRAFCAPVLIHKNDADLFGVKYDHEIKEGDTIDFAGAKIKVIETPGHTPGSVCLLFNNIMLTGDTLFYGSIGRTDFGGDGDVMMQTLAYKFKDIPGETILYPGHGPETTMADERKHNPFLIKAESI